MARTTITVDGFLAAIARHASSVYISLVGDADPIARTAIAAVLVHAHLATNNELASETVIDIRELASMSAQCFEHLTTWLAMVRDLPRPRPYKITFLANETFDWQRHCLGSLQQLAPELIEIVL